MTKYSSINVIYRLQKWIDSVPGQTFLNYAYSWGASIVILGTLFKLTHLPGANLMLYIGMGTEVIVFFISAFDRPFDKTADGMDLPTHVADEGEETAPVVAPVAVPTARPAVSAAGPVANVAAPAAASTAVQPQPAPVVSTDMQEATANYVTELNQLTEMLKKVSEQSSRLTTDSEEMENLNRTLTGICRVYEMQLKSASQQMGTIDQINEQTNRMAQQIAELNAIYARMIEAMSVRANLQS